jgi:hypothetical protein
MRVWGWKVEGEVEVKVEVERSSGGSRAGFAAQQVPSDRAVRRLRLGEVPMGRAGAMQRGKSRRTERGE